MTVESDVTAKTIWTAVAGSPADTAATLAIAKRPLASTSPERCRDR
jgi:hypothetical protein